MRSFRWALALPVFLVLVSGCSETFGRRMPTCDRVSGTVIISVQSVFGADFVPCVNELKAGWDYEHLHADSSRSVFSLNSDRMGSSFLKVTLAPSCDITGAREAPTDEVGARLFMDIQATPLGIPVTIITEGTGSETLTYAGELAAEFEGTAIEGRRIDVGMVLDGAPVADRIARAQAAGSFVLVISVRDAEERTVGFLLPDGEQEQGGLSLAEALDLLEDSVTPLSYQGHWYYVFEGGCITYEFDAQGPGVETIEQDVQAALGVWESEAVKQVGRDAGFQIP